MKIGLIFKYFAIILLAILFINTEIWANDGSKTDKSKAEIDTLIEKTGSIAPDWWDSVELRVPETLDMNWPVRMGFQQGRGGFGYRGGRVIFSVFLILLILPFISLSEANEFYLLCDFICFALIRAC